MRKTALIAVFLAFFAFAATSQAKKPNKPLPNGAAVDQYTEGIPEMAGQKPENKGGGNLPPGTAESLGSLGKAGARAAALAKATAPSPSGAESQSSGLGIWLWLILAACLLAALTRFIVQRRSSRPAA